MKYAWVTVSLLVAAVALLFTMPTISGWLVATALRHDVLGTADAECECAALAHPDDAPVWLGYAEIASAYADRRAWVATDEGQALTRERHLLAPGPAPATGWQSAFVHAIELAPEDAVPRIRYALALIARSGDLLRHDEFPDQPKAPLPPPRTESQVAYLHAAQAALEGCRKLDPTSSACDYLLGWTYLAERRDREAMALFDAATAKARFDLYTHEGVVARLRALKLAGFGNARAYEVAEWTTPPGRGKALRSIGRMAGSFARSAVADGDHARAVRCLRVAVHLGHVMRVCAYDTIEGLDARMVSSCAGLPLTASQEQQRRGLAPGASTSDWSTQARLANTVGYLRAHGDADLATFLQKEAEAARLWHEALRADFDKERAERRDSPLFTAYALLGLGGLLMLQAAAVLLLSQVLVDSPDPMTPVRPGYVAWLGLLIGGATPGQIGAYLFRHPQLLGVEALQGWLGDSAWWPRVILPAAAMAGSLFWHTGALLVAVRWWRRGERGSTDLWRTYLGVVRRLALVTVAGLLFASALVLWPMYHAGGGYETSHRAMLEQGSARVRNLPETNPGPMPK